MQLKHHYHSSAGLKRHFERLPDHREASSRLRSKAFGASGRFSAWLARACWCAKLQQNGRHHPTHLLWRDGTLAALPWSMHGLSELTCQIQLVHNQGHQPTPAFKLLWGAHMHPVPQQRLLEKAIAVFLREPTTIVLGHLRQGDDRIEHDEPAHPWIPFAACGRFALDLDHRQVQFPILLKMQVIQAADLDLSQRLIWTVRPDVCSWL